jgi:hypothetical protein
MKGKLSGLPFRGHFDPTLHPLHTVHANLVGPITPATNSGCCYFLTLVDQHTGYISITLLKKKSCATKAILDFKIFFEKQTGITSFDSSLMEVVNFATGLSWIISRNLEFNTTSLHHTPPNTTGLLSAPIKQSLTWGAA